MKITVDNEAIGTKLTVDAPDGLSKKRQYMIKSLGILILMCTYNDEADIEQQEKFQEFVDIMKEAIAKAQQLYKDKDDECDPTEQF